MIRLYSLVYLHGVPTSISELLYSDVYVFCLEQALVSSIGTQITQAHFVWHIYGDNIFTVLG